MNRQQALIEIKNFLSELPSNQAKHFLDHLLGIFDDPEGWLKGVDFDVFRGVIRKHYYKTYRHDTRRTPNEESLYSR